MTEYIFWFLTIFLVVMFCFKFCFIFHFVCFYGMVSCLFFFKKIFKNVIILFILFILYLLRYFLICFCLLSISLRDCKIIRRGNFGQVFLLLSRSPHTWRLYSRVVLFLQTCVFFFFFFFFWEGDLPFPIVKSI